MGIMIGGALIAAATDLTYSPYGYGAVLCNDILTSLYLIMVKNAPATKGLTTTRMLFYNSTMSIPLLFVAGLITKEPFRLIYAPQLQDTRFLVRLVCIDSPECVYISLDILFSLLFVVMQFILFVASGLGLSINHSTFVCTRINEPLMTSVAGNLKNAVMTVVGAIAFPDFVFDPWNALGLGLSMAGAVWYATRSALRARQKSITDSLLQQQPIIGKDRLRKLSGSQMDESQSYVVRNDSLEMRVTQSPVSAATS